MARDRSEPSRTRYSQPSGNFAGTGQLVDVLDSGSLVLANVEGIDFGTNLSVTDNGDGTVTVAASGGGGGGSSGTPPQKSDFNTVNFASSDKLVDTPNGLKIEVNSTANGAKILTRSAPSTPYTVRAFISGNISEEFDKFGLGFRDSVSGNLVVINSADEAQGLLVTEASNATDWDTNPADLFVNITPYLANIFFEVEDDGTDLHFRYSVTGIGYNEIYSASRTAHLSNAPDQIVLFKGPFAAKTEGSAAVFAYYEPANSLDRFAPWFHSLDETQTWS